MRDTPVNGPVRPYRLVFTHRRLPELNTRATRRNRFAQAAEAKRWQQIVLTYVLAQGGGPPKPLTVALVTLTRHSSREPDPDNLATSFKSILDSLVKAGVLADDKPQNFVGGHPVYRWSAAPPDKGCIEVDVREAMSDA